MHYDQAKYFCREWGNRALVKNRVAALPSGREFGGGPPVPRRERPRRPPREVKTHAQTGILVTQRIKPIIDI